jgi:drug/metabolite transporter (DMT)-like permease
MRGALFILIAALAWGLEYPLMTAATRAVGVLVTGACLFGIGSLLLAVVVIVRYVRHRAEKVAWRAFGPALLVGACGIGANMAGLAGARLTSSVNLAVLSRSDVLFSLLLSMLVLREHIARRAFLFVPVMLAGAALVTGVFRGSVQALSAGDALILLSALCIAVNGFAIRWVTRRLHGVTLGFVNCTLNALWFVALVAWRESLAALPQALTGEVGLALVGLGVLAVLFFAFYNLGLRTVPVWEARLICLLAPVTTAVVSWGIQHEHPQPGQIPGMALVLAGAAGIVWLWAGREAATAAPDSPELAMTKERASA